MVPASDGSCLRHRGRRFVHFETAHVLIDIQGNVTVFSGMTTQGQGQLTTYAQFALRRSAVTSSA